MTELCSLPSLPSDEEAALAQVDASPPTPATMQRAESAARSVTSAISSFFRPQRRAKRKLQATEEQSDASAAASMSPRYRLRCLLPASDAAATSASTLLPELRDCSRLTASQLFLHTAETKPDAVIRTADGCVIIHVRRFLSPLCIRLLQEVTAGIRDWQTGTLYGHPLPRRSIWYGPAPYKYAARLWPCFPHPPFLSLLGSLLTAHVRLCLVPSCQQLTGCLVNRYRDGNDSMGKHSDDEAELGLQPTIVSLSIGETRSFCMARKQAPAGGGKRKTEKFELESGSLLVMAGETQTHWLHWVPKEPKLTSSRINLTYRPWVL